MEIVSIDCLFYFSNLFCIIYFIFIFINVSMFYVQVKLSVAGVSQKNKNYPLFRPSVPDLNQGSDTKCNGWIN